MFIIYADGNVLSASTLLDDGRYAIDDPSVKAELNNKPRSCSFTLKSTNWLYDSLKKYKTKIKIYQDEEVIFSGRVVSLNTTLFGDRSVNCEGALSYFNDSQGLPFEKTSMAPRDRFVQIIETHNAQVETEKRFTPGIVTIEEITAQDFEETGYNSSLSLLDGLVSRFGGYLVVRDTGDCLYLDWVKTYGHMCTQPIVFGENLIDYNETESFDEPWSVLLPYGYNKTSIADVNNGSIYLEFPDLIEMYGRIVKVVNFSEAETASELLEKTKKWAEKNKEEPGSSIMVTVLDLHKLNPLIESFSLGDSINAILLPFNRTRTYTCTEIEWKLLTPKETPLTLGRPRQRLTDIYIRDKNNLDTRLNDHDYAIDQNSRGIAYNKEAIGQNTKDIEVNARNILVNAENIEANAEKIDFNAQEINLNAEQIKANAQEISLRAYSEDLEYVKTDVQHHSDELGGLHEETERLFSRMNTVEVDLNGEGANLGLKALTAEIWGDVRKVEDNFDALSNQVNEQGERVTSAEANINSMKGEIELRVRSTEFNNELEKIDNSITVNRQEIALKVSKNDVINQINVSSEGIVISANRVNLSGYVTANTFNAEIANIKKLTSVLSTTGYITANGMTVNNGLYVDGVIQYKGSNLSKSSVEYLTGGSISVSLNVSEGSCYAYSTSSATVRSKIDYVAGVSVRSATFSPKTNTINYISY